MAILYEVLKHFVPTQMSDLNRDHSSAANLSGDSRTELLSSGNLTGKTRQDQELIKLLLHICRNNLCEGISKVFGEFLIDGFKGCIGIKIEAILGFAKRGFEC